MRLLGSPALQVFVFHGRHDEGADGFAFVLDHGHVFATGQTGNIVLLCMNLAEGAWLGVARYLVSNTFFMISVRSLLTPVFAYSFYNNMLYQVQQRSMGRLVEHLTLTDPQAVQRYAELMQGGMGQGYQQAVQMANSNLYALLQTQGLLLSLKILFGYLLLAAVVLAVASALIPFHQTVRVPVVRAGTDMA